jgi:Putative Ig domain
VTHPLVPATVPHATEGVPYSTQLQAGLSGTPTWQLTPSTPLPAGLALSPGGRPLGQTQEPGDAAFGVTVTNDAGELLSSAVVVHVWCAHQVDGPFLVAWQHAVGEPVPLPPDLPDKPVAQVEQTLGQVVVLYADGTTERPP